MDSPPDVSRPPRGVVPATPELAGRLAASLSPDHVREVRDAAGLPPYAAVSLSLAASIEAYAYVPDGDVVLMMGVEEAGVLTGAAMVWMLATERVAVRPSGVLRAARWGVARAFAVTGADALEQYIPAWYRAGLRFALRLGFELSPEPRRGPGGTPLWRAAIRTGQVRGKERHGNTAKF